MRSANVRGQELFIVLQPLSGAIIVRLCMHRMEEKRIYGEGRADMHVLRIRQAQSVAKHGQDHVTGVPFEPLVFDGLWKKDNGNQGMDNWDDAAAEVNGE